MRCFVWLLTGWLPLALAGCAGKGPEIVTGYEYTSTVKMKSVMIPKPLKGGQNKFDLVVEEKTYPLEAGKRFFFKQDFPEGVDKFTVKGINPAEQLAATNINAFPTGISFMKEGTTGESINMKPIMYRPAFRSGWVLGTVGVVGVVCIGGFWWLRKQPA